MNSDERNAESAALKKSLDRQFNTTIVVIWLLILILVTVVGFGAFMYGLQVGLN